MPPAARVSDQHACPLASPNPHVGGAVLPPGAPTVLIGGLPAARATDLLACAGPPNAIALGSPTVLIAGLPAARLGDGTAHGGTLASGEPTVLIN